MCWDHGRNVPSWNTSLLPDDQRLDVGIDVNERADSGEHSPQPEKSEKRSAHSQLVSGKKKKTASAANVAAAGQEDPLTSLIQVTLLLAPLNIARNTFIR
jgi:hypothetical protein